MGIGLVIRQWELASSLVSGNWPCRSSVGIGIFIGKWELALSFVSGNWLFIGKWELAAKETVYVSPLAQMMFPFFFLFLLQAIFWVGETGST